MEIKEIKYSSKFERKFDKLTNEVKYQAAEKEKLFRKNPFDTKLKAHLLKGVLKNRYAFSINYSYRIIFVFEDSNTVTFMDIGDHSIYK